MYPKGPVYPKGAMYKNYDHYDDVLPSQRRFSRKSEWVDLQRTVGTQQPFRISGLPMPTSQQLYCNPVKKNKQK